MKFKTHIILIIVICLCLFLTIPFFKHKSQRQQVIEWLLKHPGNKFPTLKKVVPFETFEQWENAGQKLKDVENILFKLYKEDDPKVFKSVILRAFGCVGSEKSISFLIETIQNKSLDSFDRLQAVWSLGRMSNRGFNVFDAIEPLSQIALDPEEDNILRINSISSLGLIGNPNTIPVFQKALDDPNFSEFQKEKTILRFLNHLQEKNITSDVNESI